MNANHPGLVEIEAARTGEADAETARHVKSCPACQAALADLVAVAARFGQEKAKALPIPPTVDNAMFGMIRERAAEVRRQHRPIRLPAWLSRVAAAVLVASAATWLMLEHRPKPAVPVASVSNERLERKPDMVDAYLLARQVRRGDKVSGRWDRNGDGQVDQRDVIEVAREAVAVKASL